jgi:hypothetical protein
MIRAIAFLSFAMACSAGAPDAEPACGVAPERLEVRVRRHSGEEIGCGGPSLGAVPAHVRTRTRVLGVENHAFELDACPSNADCRAPMRTRVTLTGESLPDLATIHAPQQYVAFALDIEPGTPCRWRMTVSDPKDSRPLFVVQDGIVAGASTERFTATATSCPDGRAALSMRDEHAHSPPVGVGSTWRGEVVFHNSRAVAAGGAIRDLAYWIARPRPAALRD